MKSFLKLLGIFGFILLTSSVLAPVLADFLPYKFHRILNRLIMIQSIAAICIFVRVNRDTLKSYGIFWTQNSLPDFLKTVATSFVVLTSLSFLKVAFHQMAWQSPVPEVGEVIFRMGKDFGSAVVIGVIEEIFFRGVIFQTFYQKNKWGLVPSLFLTNIFYSSVHFLSSKKPFVGPDPTFIDSWRVLLGPFDSVQHWVTVWPGFIGLLIFGLILNELVLRTKSLYPAIGLHAGAVLFIKSDALFVDSITDPTLVWGSAKAYDGIIGWIFLAGMFAILRLVIKKRVSE